MKQIKIKSISALRAVDGTLQLLLAVDGEFTAKAEKAAQNANERLTASKDVGITIERYKKARSLDANAYFHVLCDKIAEVLHSDLDEVKTQMVISYGTPLYSVTIPEAAKITDFWRYSRWIGGADGKNTYLLYKQTHTLDSKEMARLIEGTIAEAKPLGIVTATPKELAEMAQQWENAYGR